jgi:hypothetical protein
MDKIPARIIRRSIADHLARQPVTQRDRDNQAYILQAAERMFVACGRTDMNLAHFAYTIDLGVGTIRRLLCDMEHIFGHVLHKHLDAIEEAVNGVKPGRPDLPVRRRAAYFQATRAIGDIPTPLHFLLLRERFAMPGDEREPVERRRALIGRLIAGDRWEETLYLLDCPSFDLEKIEAAIAASEKFDRERLTARRPAPLPPVVSSADASLAHVADRQLRAGVLPACAAEKPSPAVDQTRPIEAGSGIGHGSRRYPDWDTLPALGETPKTRH